MKKKDWNQRSQEKDMKEKEKEGICSLCSSYLFSVVFFKVWLCLIEFK